MLETPPSFKLGLKNVLTVKFNIASDNLAKRTRAHGTKPLLSLYSGIQGLAELQEVKVQGFFAGLRGTCRAPALSIYLGEPSKAHSIRGLWLTPAL